MKTTINRRAFLALLSGVSLAAIGKACIDSACPDLGAGEALSVKAAPSKGCRAELWLDRNGEKVCLQAKWVEINPDGATHYTFDVDLAVNMLAHDRLYAVVTPL